MSNVGLEPDSSTTRPLYLHISKSAALPPKAWAVLQALHENDHAIPVAAANVVIEASIAVGPFREAVELYKQLHKICESGPNTETFNILFQGLSKSGPKGMAMFLASEMKALGIKADDLTYDRLILICLREDDYEDAFRYLEEMKAIGRDKGEGSQKGWWMRGGTSSALVRRCIVAGDKRAWDILSEMEVRGVGSAKLRNWAEENWNGKPRAITQSEGKLKNWATMR